MILGDRKNLSGGIIRCPSIGQDHLPSPVPFRFLSRTTQRLSLNIGHIIPRLTNLITSSPHLTTHTTQSIRITSSQPSTSQQRTAVRQSMSNLSLSQFTKLRWHITKYRPRLRGSVV
jgi:hypothetical protein